MIDVTIDCSLIHSRENLHRVFAQALSLPAHYGNNLDALHDILTSLSGRLRLKNWEEAEAALGRYGQTARRMLVTTALENTALDLII